MKKVILSMLVVAIASTMSFAQTKQKAPKSPEDRADRQVERMDREVTLTDAQKPKIKEILVKRDQAREDLNKQYPDKNSDAYREANRKLFSESEKEIKAVLTPEQLEKQKQAREEQRQKHKAGEKGTPPPAPGQTPPPPAPAPAQPK